MLVSSLLSIASVALSALPGTTDVALLLLSLVLVVPLLLEMVLLELLLVLFPMLVADVDDGVEPAADVVVTVVDAEDDETVDNDEGGDAVDVVTVLLVTGAAVATDAVVTVVLPEVALGCG